MDGFEDILMECLPWTDYDARIKSSVVFIPVGAIEQARTAVFNSQFIFLFL